MSLKSYPNEAVNSLFQQYGSPAESVSFYNHFSGHIRRPDLLELDEISRHDRSAAVLIAELQETINQLNAYRVELAGRYNDLATAPKIPVVKLTSRRASSYGSDAGKVFYFLTTHERYLTDGHEIKLTSTKYPGTQRNQAIKDYHAYVKAHPGIAAEMDIEKPRWER
jgi:hypothetical protein